MNTFTKQGVGIAILVGLLACVGVGEGGEEGELPASLVEAVRGMESVEAAMLPALDLAKVMTEDRKREEEGMAPRFAVPVPMFETVATAGTWDTLSNGDLLWRRRFHAEGALSLNFGLTRFHLPPTARLWVYSPDYGQILGPYTDRDNEAHRQLWTPVVLGDEAVLELRIAPAMVPYLELELTHVGHGYTGFGYPSALKSGSCNLDVVCSAGDGYPQVDGWRDPIRSVAVIGTGGSTFCTGFLVNNTAQDRTPYFMTANHCGISSGNAASLVVYWNYENSTCRPPGSSASGGPGDGSLADNQTGSIFRAARSASDFTIVERDADPPPSSNVHWAGWDRRSIDFPSAVGIHHPSTDEKRISFENDPTSTTTYLGTTVPGDGTHVRITDWDLGTTEPGSSGSPVFSPDRRVIGQLHGGYAACGNDDSDWYGRFSVSWDAGGAANARLSDWLDPGATGAETLDGRDACTAPVFDFTITPNPAQPNQQVSFVASVTSGVPPYQYAWDLNGDTVVDCTDASCFFTYTAYYNGNVTLTVTDSSPCSGSVTHAMVVDAARLEYVSAGGATETCGDGDAIVEPGETWTVDVTVENTGSQAAIGAQAPVVVQGSPTTVVITTGPADFGSVPAGGEVTVPFEFLIDPSFSPCGSALVFDLGVITWSGGAAPGETAIHTAYTGGGTGTQDVYAEGFENAETWGGLDYPGTDKWSVTTGPGPHTGGAWQRTSSDSPVRRPAGSTGFFALADSDAAGSGGTTSTVLTSPMVNLAGYTFAGTVTLDVDLYFNYYSFGGTEVATVEVFDGSNWQVVATYDGSTDDVNAHQSYDVTAYASGNPQFQARFSYQNAAYDWWFSVDNVRVVAPLDPVCDNATVCGTADGIFADDFEGGNTSAWSLVTP